ncbi:hypothetical protein ACP4OV_002086 [Aristida adscensionis]
MKKGTGLLLLVALVAMVFSCHATDYCHAVVPCTYETCFNYCQKNNYKNFQIYCTQGQYYPVCCCRVPDAAATLSAHPPPPPAAETSDDVRRQPGQP